MGDEVTDTLKQTEFNTLPVFGPLFTDPEPIRMALSPGKMTLEGVDSLLEFLDSQRAAVGARVQALRRGVSGDELASINTRFLADQTRLLAHLLMLY
jgi:hypothetical protein